MMTHLRRNYCYTLLFLLAVCLSFTACVPEGIELPSRVKSIATDVATSVTSNGAKLCGVVSVYDTDTISCGIIYDTSSTLSSTSGTLKPTSANGKYSVPIGGLKANTTYYYRAYALDAGVYKYGKVLSFKTDNSVVTGNATDILDCMVTLHGEVDCGGDEPLACGFIYGTSSAKLLSYGKRVATTSSGKFSVGVSNLQPGTTYYYCAYAIIGGKEQYGEVGSFTTTLQSESESYTVNGVSFTMIGVEGGTFTMGATSEQGSDAYSDEKPTHEVTLSNYSIGETEVTQALWKAVMDNNPSYYTGDLQRPVDYVSWNDCQEFISKLNELTGENFRLPTEAEWEYAARGGNMSNGYKYSGSNTIDDVAWYYDNSSTTTHAVKTKQPNELGIYDMSGNVSEWCSDWYGSYSSSAQTNPTGPSSGFSRVLRGGSRLSSAEGCRVAIRSSNFPDSRGYNYGLRLALQFIP